MNCARKACQEPLREMAFRIDNDNTVQGRVYCVACGRKIVELNPGIPYEIFNVSGHPPKPTPIKWALFWAHGHFGGELWLKLDPDALPDQFGSEPCPFIDPIAGVGYSREELSPIAHPENDQEVLDLWRNVPC